MSEESTQGSQPATSAEQGTTQGVQPESAQGQANDPSSFQADYTKKYQELSDSRKSFEAEKAQFEQERAQFRQASQNYNGYSAQPYQQGYQQGYQQPQYNGYSQVTP